MMWGHWRLLLPTARLCWKPGCFLCFCLNHLGPPRVPDWPQTHAASKGSQAWHGPFSLPHPGRSWAGQTGSDCGAMKPLCCFKVHGLGSGRLGLLFLQHAEHSRFSPAEKTTEKKNPNIWIPHSRACCLSFIASPKCPSETANLQEKLNPHQTPFNFIHLA